MESISALIAVLLIALLVFVIRIYRTLCDISNDISNQIYRSGFSPEQIDLLDSFKNKSDE